MERIEKWRDSIRKAEEKGWEYKKELGSLFKEITTKMKKIEPIMTKHIVLVDFLTYLLRHTTFSLLESYGILETVKDELRSIAVSEYQMHFKQPEKGFYV